MTRKVYTIGYSGRKPAQVATILEETEGILFDVRISPRSRNPVWNEGALRERFGKRYKHIRAFGNRNYKGGPIELVDFEAGLKAVEAVEGSVILMCVCKDYERCHRKTIAERLKTEGFTVEEIPTNGTTRCWQERLL